MSSSYPSATEALHDQEGPSTRAATSKSNLRSSTTTLKQVTHSDFYEPPASPTTPPRDTSGRLPQKRKRRSTSSPPLGRNESPKELKRFPSLGDHSFGKPPERAFSPLRLLPATNPTLELHRAYDASYEPAEAFPILTAPQHLPVQTTEIESNLSSVSRESHPWEHSRRLLEKGPENPISINDASQFSIRLASPQNPHTPSQVSRDPWSSDDSSSQTNQAASERIVLSSNSSADRAIKALLASPVEPTKRKPVTSEAAPIPTNIPPNWSLALPRFSVGRVFLGKGAHCLVFEGQDEINKKTVAMKAIPCGQHRQPSLADARREISIQRLATTDDSGARHKNIAAFLDSVETPDICCAFCITSFISNADRPPFDLVLVLILDRAPNGSIEASFTILKPDDTIERNPLPERVLIRVARQICSGLLVRRSKPRRAHVLTF